MITREIASKGLYYLFISQIVALFVGIPWLGGLIAIAALGIRVYSLHIMSQAEDGYKTAFILTIINLILSVVLVFGSNLILSMAKTIIDMVIVYLIVTTTVKLLKNVDSKLAARGSMLWIAYIAVYLVTSIITAIVSVLYYIPILNVLAVLITVVLGLAQLAIGIFYLIFIWQSYKALK